MLGNAFCIVSISCRSAAIRAFRSFITASNISSGSARRPPAVKRTMLLLFPYTVPLSCISASRASSSSAFSSRWGRAYRRRSVCLYMLLALSAWDTRVAATARSTASLITVVILGETELAGMAGGSFRLNITD